MGTSVFGEYVPLPLMNSKEFVDHSTIWDEMVQDFVPRKLYELGLKPFYTMKLPESSNKLWPLVWQWIEKYDANKDKEEYKSKHEQEPLIAEYTQNYSKNVTMQEVLTIFVASSTTTKLAMNSCLVLLGKYESIQQKLYSEIMTFIKSNNGVY